MNSKTIDLNPERWARVEALFEQAIELPASERNAFLRHTCADDIELRGYVASLLASGDIDEEIEGTVADALQSAFTGGEDARKDKKGAMLGPYRIVRTLGSGGMGIVYLAERADDQFEQQVAIKEGHQRLADPQTEKRLRAERQILANLDHPNIARLLDGGTAEDGRPYLVMEYIDGVRIDTYCDRHRLGIGKRLELFRTICAAVHYAHQNLVVHRDIKASNILVTEDGTPKLLDFGIAKLIDTGGTAAAGLTREGLILMTPESAAPEQVTGKPITTATDTYALGLLLYSLLTGMPPYPVADLHPAEIARIVCQQIPEAPSLRIADQLRDARRDQDETRIETLELIGRSRNLSIDRLQKRLRGDLDTIVLNALRKEPERRYRSVNQFAEDANLHQKSMPILARSDSWQYRTGKFLRRHYAGVSMSALLLAMLIAFGVVMSIQNQRIALERDVAQEVSGFLEDIFMAPDPAQARGLDITAKEILANGADRIGNELQGRPEIQAALMQTIGRVYLNLGEYQPSVEFLEQSLRLRQQALGDDHPSIAANKNELAESLIRQADYERAQQLLNEALRQNRDQRGEYSLAVGQNLFNLAEVHLATGELAEAERFASESVDIYSRLEQGHEIELAEAKSLLARVMQVTGDLDTTERLLREAIELVRSSAGPDHPLMAYYLQNLGVLLQSKGDLDLAEITLNQAIESTRRILGDKHDLVAATLVMQGTLQHNKGNFEAAEQSLRDALSLHRDTLESGHPWIGYDLTSLGMLLHDTGELAEAERLLHEALQIYEQSLAEDHQYIASALTALGAVMNSAGDAAQAEEILIRAMAIRSKDYPQDHPLAAATHTVYGDTLVSLGRYAEAEEMLLPSFEVLRGQNDRRSRRALQAVIRLYENSGEQAEAARYRRLRTGL